MAASTEADEPSESKDVTFVGATNRAIGISNDFGTVVAVRSGIDLQVAAIGRLRLQSLSSSRFRIKHDETLQARSKPQTANSTNSTAVEAKEPQKVTQKRLEMRFCKDWGTWDPYRQPLDPQRRGMAVGRSTPERIKCMCCS